MNSFFWFLAWTLGLGALAYHRFSLITCSISVFTALIISVFAGGISILTFILGLIITSLISYALLDKEVRRTYIISPILQTLKKSMPSISKTENEALQAGSVWWDGELFTGKPNWQKLLKMNSPGLSKEEQDFLNGPVEKLCSMIDNWQINYIDKDIPNEMWDFIKSEKFFGLMIPKKYDGLGFSALAHSEILSKISGKSITVASTVSVPNSLGPAELLLHYGTDAQKKQYLPKLAIGTEVPCFALTGPNAGSDATAIPDTGIVGYGQFKGKKTLGIKLNWDKRYITLAPIATVLGIAFKLQDPDGLIGKDKEVGITCALIPTKTKGITIGNRHMPLNTMFQNGPTQGKDVFIPLEWIIGGPSMAGSGWKMLVECLSCGRAISLPSLTAGNARAAAAASGAYAKIRVQFNQPIGNFEGIEEPLARIASNVYISDAARVATAASIDNGEAPTVPGAIVKYHVTEMARKVSIDAMDIHGGKGIMLGPKNYMAEGYINSPIGITVEGANILTRNLIIFGQGAIRAHPYIMKELDTLSGTSNAQILTELDTLLGQHVSYSISNAARSLFGYITRGKLINSPVKHKASKFYQWVSWSSSAFALLADASLIVLGGKLKFKEKLSARLGDLLSMLYLASTTLKRFEDEGHPEEDLDLLEYSIRKLMNNFWTSINEILENFPNRQIAFGLRCLIMPLGIPIRKPGDNLDKRIAKMMMYPSPARDRLIKNTYLSANDKNPVGQLQIALKHVIAAEDIERRMRKSIKDGVITGNNFAERIAQALKTSLITDAESSLLKQAQAAREQIIAVDDFEASSFRSESRKKA